jgi:predicted Zn finger-like uncharacterized protein
MITSCTGCETRYRLDDEKVPRRRVRVRCPGCQTIFELDGTLAAAGDQVTGLESSAGDRQPATAPPSPAATNELGIETNERPTSVLGGAPADEARPTPVSSPSADSSQPAAAKSPAAKSPAAKSPTAESPAAKSPAPIPAAEVTSQDAQSAVAVADAPKAAGGRRNRDKARMLARALVSDILVYNRDARDKAVAEGNLLEVLGPEIKKSWELYKEKVGEDVANNTTHFRDALNEILAGGDKIF